MRQRDVVKPLELPTVSGHWLGPFARTLDRLGAPVEDMARRSMVALQVLEEPNLRMPERPIWHLLDLAAREGGISDLGFRIAHSESLETVGPFVQQIDRAPGFSDVVRQFAHEAPHSGFSLESFGNRTWFCRRGPGIETGAWTMEQYTTTLMVQAVRRYASPRWSPDAVCLQTTDLSGIESSDWAATAELHIGCEVTAIALSETLLARSGSRDARDRDGSDDWVRELQKVLESYLPDGYPDVRMSAEILGTSSRTLQRRLESEGISYSTIVRGARQRVATRLLEDPTRKLIDVAYDIGYRDPGSFSRAFRSWTGLSPREYRAGLSREVAEG